MTDYLGKGKMRKLLIPFEVLVLSGLVLTVYVNTHPDSQTALTVKAYLNTARGYVTTTLPYLWSTACAAGIAFTAFYLYWKRLESNMYVWCCVESLKSAAWELIREMENEGPSWKKRLDLARDITGQFAVEGAAKLGSAQSAAVNNTDSSHNEIMRQVTETTIDRWLKDQGKFSTGLGALRDGVSIFLQIMDGRPMGAYTAMLVYMKKQASGKNVPNFDHLKEAMGIPTDPPDAKMVKRLYNEGISNSMYTRLAKVAGMPEQVLGGLVYTPLVLGEGEEITITGTHILRAMRDYLRTLDIKLPID
jgi:hypothetical protein